MLAESISFSFLIHKKTCQMLACLQTENPKGISFQGISFIHVGVHISQTSYLSPEREREKKRKRYYKFEYL